MNNIFSNSVDMSSQRSLLRALGWTDEEMGRPLVGIICAQSEIIPGHMHLDDIARAAAEGVISAGGKPIIMPSIGVCDGIAMGHAGMRYSLPSREIIADSAEILLRAHGIQAAIFIGNCDKIIPGMLMAAARVNIPSIFVSGGPMLAGHVHGKKTSLSTMFEQVGAYNAGKIDGDELKNYECNACPTCGSCSGMFTANSLNCLTEALGMALPGNGTIPMVYSARLALAKRTGVAVMQLLKKNIRPADIMTPAAFKNAETVDMAIGASTNTALHLIAVAREAGLTESEISVDTMNGISERTPNLCRLAPAGEHYIEELNEAGGISAVMKELLDARLLDGTVLTKYVEEGEMVTAGKPLFTIADMDELYVRAYFSAAQLAGLKPGDRVKVLPDDGSRQLREYGGTVTWISEEAEFTPKNIQTRDERADLVYAVKVAVDKGSPLRLGMYAYIVAD